MRYRTRHQPGDPIRLGHDPRFGADFKGRPVQPQTITRNCQDEFVYRIFDRHAASERRPSAASQLPELRRRVRKLLRWAQQERGLTPVEVVTLRLRLEGHTQSEIAQLQGVNRQAVFSRFDGRRSPSGGRWGGIFNKAPELVAVCKRADQFRHAYGRIVQP